MQLVSKNWKELRRITSRAFKARVRRRNQVSKTRVLIADMKMFLPHGTRVFKTRVPQKKKNEDDDEVEEPEIKEEAPDSKTSLENADTRIRIGEEEAEVLDLKTSLENTDLKKKNHGLEERRTWEEEEATQALGK